MPDTQNEGAQAGNLAPDQGVSIPRMKLGEVGFNGIRIASKQILEEANRVFRYPAFIKTVNEMRNNPTVGAAMNVYRFMISRVKWSVKAPADATEKDKERAKIVETMMHDMDSAWDDFITEVIPYIEYGFDVHEKVFRRRLPRYGSKYNDGLVGIKKLAPRSQDTITGWIFDDNGDDLLAIEQSMNWLENSARFQNRTNQDGKIEIPREKFLLFTSSKTKGNPQGNSIFKNIYLAFKQLTILQDQQLLGISKGIQGILKVEIPAMYLSPDATPEQQATAKGFQSIIDQANDGTLKGMLVPRIFDDGGKSLFDYSLIEYKGNSPYNIESVIQGLQNDILTALNVDILRLGANGSGSFSLAESKTSILALAIDSRLKEIASVLNHDLMVQIYQLNGWELKNIPKFVYEEPEDIDLDSFSSAIQRIFAVGAIEVDRNVLNRVREKIGVDLRPDDEPVQVDQISTNITGKSTRSGDGMAPGTSGNGTAKIGGKSSGKDSSVANKENAP